MVKEVEGGNGKRIVWFTGLPFEYNIIEWTTDYKLYSSKEKLERNVSVWTLSNTVASDNVVYDFEDSVFRNAKAADCVSINEYAVHNAMHQYDCLSFGMAQDIKVNGIEAESRPINVLELPYNHTAVMRPLETVSVFLASNVDDGMVCHKEFYNELVVDFRGDETEKRIRYDCDRGKFVF